MSVTARTLEERGCAGDFGDFIRHQLESIDDRLEKTPPRWGRNVVKYDLPTTFPFASMDRSDCQRIVYAAIITSLRDRGFDVGIVLDGVKARIIVAWDVSLTEIEIARFTETIKGVRLTTPRDIENFCRTGAKKADEAGGEGGAAPPSTA